MTVDARSADDRARLGGVARGSTANLLGAVVSSFATLGLTLVITRGLPQASAGVFFSATSLFMVAITVGQLGTNVGLVYFLSRARSWGQPHLRRDLFTKATRPVMVVAVVMAVLLFVFATQVSEVINADHVEQSAGYLRGVAAFIPLAGLQSVTLAGTRGMGTMRANVITEQLGRPLVQLILVALSIAAFGGRHLGVAWALAYLPMALLALRYWRRIGAVADRQAVGAEPVSTRRSAVPTRREFWGFSAPRAAASVAQVAMQRGDIVLVAILAGAVPAAIYTASTRFLVLGQMGQRAISLAVQPALGEALAVDDTVHAKRLYRISTVWLMLVTWPMYLMFSFFGERLLAVFGRDYSAGNQVLLLLSLTMLLSTACGMVDVVLVMAGKSSWSLYNLLLSVGVQMGVDVALIPHYGILGAAIGWSAGILAANLVPLLQVGLVVRLHPFGRSSYVAIGLLLGCFALVPAASRLLLGNTWGAFAVSGLVGGTAYLVGLWWLREVLSLTALADIRHRKGGRRHA